MGRNSLKEGSAGTVPRPLIEFQEGGELWPLFGISQAKRGNGGEAKLEGLGIVPNQNKEG